MIGGNDNAAARHAIAGGYPRLILAFAILLAATGVSPAAAQDGLAKLSGKWFFDQMTIYDCGASSHQRGNLTIGKEVRPGEYAATVSGWSQQRDNPYCRGRFICKGYNFNAATTVKDKAGAVRVHFPRPKKCGGPYGFLYLRVGVHIMAARYDVKKLKLRGMAFFGRTSAAGTASVSGVDLQGLSTIEDHGLLNADIVFGRAMEQSGETPVKRPSGRKCTAEEVLQGRPGCK